jgi:dolichol-phosphate mannosyltransferase
MKPQVSIIIPTLNEEENIFKLYYKIKKDLKNKSYEIIFVDDKSSDNTKRRILTLKSQYSNVNAIFRKERNLSTAFLDGARIAQGKFTVLMDSDLQHSPVDINKMLYLINNSNYDFVIGSRFLKNSTCETTTVISKIRITLSKFMVLLISFFFKIKIKDPLSGFFICKKESLKNSKKLYKKGFKILLDYLISKNTLKTKEISITMNKRMHGNSKLNVRIIFEFIKQCNFYLFK